MKIEMYAEDHRTVIAFEPETPLEEFALDYLAGRPTKEVVVLNTRLGVFERKDDRA